MQTGNDPAISEWNKPPINPNEVKVGLIESAPPDYTQSQLNQSQPGQYPPAYNPQFNQPPGQYPTGIVNPQFNQPQAQYPMGNYNPQLNQPPGQYPMGINNPQFNQPPGQYPMGINNPQFNQLQPQYPMGVNSQINPQMTMGGNTLVNQPQSNQVITVNVNQPTATKEEILIVTQPPNHKVLALFSCLCCIWPIGALALYKSCEVDSAFADGKYIKAQHASIAARRYALISIGLGFLLIILAIVLSVTRSAY